MNILLHKALVIYVLAFMAHFFPPAHWQEKSYAEQAEAMATAADDNADDAVQLAALASFESGYNEKAVGKVGEMGAFQLRPFPERHASCAPWSANPGRWVRPSGELPRLEQCSLTEQARIALYRWKVMGRCSYSGEAPATECPLADHRYYRAFFWQQEHPFVVPEESSGPLATR